MYCYIRSEPGLFTVGFYNPHGDFITESDHDDKEKAAVRVNYLNGGNDSQEIRFLLENIVEVLISINRRVF